MAGAMAGTCLVAAGRARAAAGVELVCGLTETSPAVARLQASLRLDFVVKPQTRELCQRDRCLGLAEAGEGRLAYHCRMASDGYCLGSFDASTAGPFVNQADLVVDLSTRAFEGALTGSVGDLGPERFEVRVRGACEPVAQGAEATALALRAVSGLPDGVRGRAYGPVRVVGGGEAVSVSLVNGVLPPGLAVGPTGLLAGTPRRAGTFVFVLRAADPGDPGRTLERAYRVRVAPKGGR